MHQNICKGWRFKGAECIVVPKSDPTTCFRPAWTANWAISWSRPTQSQSTSRQTQVSRDVNKIPDMEGFDLLLSLTQEAAQPQPVLASPPPPTTTTCYNHTQAYPPNPISPVHTPRLYQQCDPSLRTSTLLVRTTRGLGVYNTYRGLLLPRRRKAKG